MILCGVNPRLTLTLILSDLQQASCEWLQKTTEVQERSALVQPQCIGCASKCRNLHIASHSILTAQQHKTCDKFLVNEYKHTEKRLRT